MNEYDSDRIRNALDTNLTDNPNEADIVIVNTCAIRDKADQKAFSSLGKFKRIKAKNPEVIVGIAGCVAQLYGDKLLSKIPHLDFVLGPRAIPKLPAIIQNIENEKLRAIETSYDIEELFDISPHHREGKVTGFVSVQQGCNKRCTYCIVPRVRGSEINRPQDDILKEARYLVDKGVREITLIGQTVNSWKENGYKFGDLLHSVAELEELKRIRFTTSYPRDVTKKMVEALRDIDKVCPHIHLPVQSGSGDVLKMMKRTYTRQWYEESVQRLRDAVPDIAISTDIIVGFPGETDRDFNLTMTLLEEIEFDSVFSFKFSPRPGTPAAAFPEDQLIDGTLASERLRELQSFQRDVTAKKNTERVGEVEQVLVEGPSRNDPSHVTGRTAHNRITNFAAPEDLVGSIVNVKVTDGLMNSVRGELI